MWPFKRKCVHPADALHVEKDSEWWPVDRGYSTVEHFLYCTDCQEKISIKYAATSSALAAATRDGDWALAAEITNPGYNEKVES